MNPLSHLIIEPPALSDHSAKEMLDFLYQLIVAFENHYAIQLMHDHDSIEPPEPEYPFNDLDDDLPPF